MRISDWSSDVCSSDLPGLVCLAANQWRVLYGAAWLGDAGAIGGVVACLFAPRLGLMLLTQAGGLRSPALRRLASSLYPAHFLILLPVRQFAARSAEPTSELQSPIGTS